MSTSILIVDDERGIRDMLQWVLVQNGHAAVTAADGALAIEMIRQTDFDVIISDLRMPNVGGLEVLRAARELAPDTAVVIATGFAEMSDAIECVRQGAFDFIQKPFHKAMVLATVTRAIEQRRLRRTAGLFEASQSILDGHEPQRLPELIVGLAMRAMDADDASLMLPDADGRFYIAHSNSLSAEVMATERVALGDGVAGRVAASGKPVVITHGVSSDPRLAEVVSDGRAKSSIVYPLLVGGRAVGVLCINRVRNPRAFRDSDLERAAILASQVLLALENSRLMRQVASSERLSAVGLLAAGIAHEINNPAACVVGNQECLQTSVAVLAGIGALVDAGASADALLRAWNAAGGTRFLTEMQEVVTDLAAAAARIMDIAGDMKSLARDDGSKPVSVSFDLNEAIRSALRITGPQLRPHATVKVELEADLPVVGSPGRLSQVFVNLLVNAGQAVSRDGGKHHIGVRSWRDEGGDDSVMVSVTDTGSGIHPDHLRRIFETFFTTKAATSGTGLGLPISRDIIELHGGHLDVHSILGQGATFTVRLPLVR
jgi:signal transduction histidine kinase/CheY-like chemotaxis protein